MCSTNGESNAPLGALTTALGQLASAEVGEDAPAALAHELAELHTAIQRLQAEYTRRLAAFDSMGGAEQTSESPTTQSWLRNELHVSPSEAKAQVTAARRLRHLPLAAEAFAHGEISWGHVRVLVRTATDWRIEGVRQLEPDLVEAARRLHPADLGKCAARIRIAIDPEAAVEDCESAYARRRLSAARTFEGMVAINGILDPVGGEAVLAVLDAMQQPDPADTPIPQQRTPDQRRADALAEWAHQTLRERPLATSGGQRPQVTVTVDLETLKGESRSMPGELSWVGPVSGETVRRIACDAQVTRVVTDGPSQTLDVGMARRSVPTPMRKAVVVRDVHCRGPGCDRPPGWCDAHHITHWADGGPTALDNLLLLCRACHRKLHEGRWTAKLLPDATVEFTTRDGQIMRTHPDPAMALARAALATA